MQISRQIMKLVFKLVFLAAGAAALLPLPAGAVGPEPAPLAKPVELTVGYQKVGHLAPFSNIAENAVDQPSPPSKPHFSLARSNLQPPSPRIAIFSPTRRTRVARPSKR